MWSETGQNKKQDRQDGQDGQGVHFQEKYSSLAMPNMQKTCMQFGEFLLVLFVGPNHP